MIITWRTENLQFNYFCFNECVCVWFYSRVMMICWQYTLEKSSLNLSTCYQLSRPTACSSPPQSTCSTLRRKRKSCSGTQGLLFLLVRRMGEMLWKLSLVSAMAALCNSLWKDIGLSLIQRKVYFWRWAAMIHVFRKNHDLPMSHVLWKLLRCF